MSPQKEKILANVCDKLLTTVEVARILRIKHKKSAKLELLLLVYSPGSPIRYHYGSGRKKTKLEEVKKHLEQLCFSKKTTANEIMQIATDCKSEFEIMLLGIYQSEFDQIINGGLQKIEQNLSLSEMELDFINYAEYVYGKGIFAKHTV